MKIMSITSLKRLKISESKLFLMANVFKQKYNFVKKVKNI